MSNAPPPEWKYKFKNYYCDLQASKWKDLKIL